MNVEESPAPWWKGTRGEWYVVAQAGLFVLVAIGPRTVPGWPAWPTALYRPAFVLGALLMAAGFAFIVAGATGLGRKNLTPLPAPRASAQLVVTGVYALVRHPIYCGGLGVAFGWALWRHGTLTLVYALLLWVFLDLKANREERWLCARFPDYPEYRKRVRKLIPFVY